MVGQQIGMFKDGQTGLGEQIAGIGGVHVGVELHHRGKRCGNASLLLGTQTRGELQVQTGGDERFGSRDHHRVVGNESGNGSARPGQQVDLILTDRSVERQEKVRLPSPVVLRSVGKIVGKVHRLREASGLKM